MTGPAFFFHLGDVIYNFGEAQYYYDQFYEPYRDYDRPIFAIPGNHDGMVYGPTPALRRFQRCEAFLRNFCAPTLSGLPRFRRSGTHGDDAAGGLFHAGCAFVSIIGLYSNVLDSGAGVISSQGGKFPVEGRRSIGILASELKRLKPDRQAGKRARYYWRFTILPRRSMPSTAARSASSRTRHLLSGGRVMAGCCPLGTCSLVPALHARGEWQAALLTSCQALEDSLRQHRRGRRRKPRTRLATPRSRSTLLWNLVI